MAPLDLIIGSLANKGEAVSIVVGTILTVNCDNAVVSSMRDC